MQGRLLLEASSHLPSPPSSHLRLSSVPPLALHSSPSVHRSYPSAFHFCSSLTLRCPKRHASSPCAADLYSSLTLRCPGRHASSPCAADLYSSLTLRGPR